MTETVVTPAANVLGTIGTVFWCIQLVPQVIHNYRRKNLEGVPPLMMFLFAVSGVPFAIYFIVQKSNIPVQVQPFVFMSLSLVCLYQCFIYPPISMKYTKAIAIMVATVAIFAGIMLGCILPLRPLYERGVTWPVTFIGVIAAVLLGAGLLPPYWELWKRGGRVVGLNFVFLLIDSLGALFSLFSLVAQKGDLDVLGCVLYIVVIVLEAGIFLSHGIWLLRTRKSRRAAKQAADEEVGDDAILEPDDASEDEIRKDPRETVREHSAHAAADIAEDVSASTSHHHHHHNQHD